MNYYLNDNFNEDKAMAGKKSGKESVYDFICRNPGKNTYQISKKLCMSGGKVRHTLSKLKQDGLIKFKIIRNTPRIQKLCYPVDAMSLLPRALKNKINFAVKNDI